MSNNFRKNHPDFVSIEHHIRRAHAERQLAIGTAIADGIVAVVRAIGRLTGSKAVERTRVVAKVSARRQAANV